MNLSRLHAGTRLFSSAVGSQAVLSCASLVVGLILVRHTADLQYGYYVLGWNAVLLLTSLQNSFFAAPVVIRLSRMDRHDRSAVVGGLYRAQQRMLPALAGTAALATLLLRFLRQVDHSTALLALAVCVTAVTILNREYFRMVLLAYRRPQDVLKGDIAYVVVLLAGVAAATLTSAPGAVAILAMGVAAGCATMLLSQSLRAHEPLNIKGARGILREIAPMGLWSCAGAAIHWSFSQGYTYLAAGTLGVGAVAAISAARLLLMPINLLSVGLASQMLPLSAAWLNEHGATLVLQRLSLFAAVLAAAALVYFGVLWQFRDWIFAVVLKKQMAQRDQLIALWFAAVLVMVVRDQMIHLLVIRTRFKLLTLLTLASAILSLTASYWGMRAFGQAGAPLGVVIGEVTSLIGIVMLSLRETDRVVTAPSPAATGEAMAQHLAPFN